MPITVQVDGAEAIARVAKAVRQVGTSRVIVNTMIKEIRSNAPEVRRAIRGNAVDYLPSGLGPWVAKARITLSVRRSASNAGITIKGGRNSLGGRTDMKAIDAGKVRHKSWGEPPWHPQSVKAGFFTDYGEQGGRELLREAAVEAADRAARVILYG